MTYDLALPSPTFTSAAPCSPRVCTEPAALAVVAAKAPAPVHDLTHGEGAGADFPIPSSDVSGSPVEDNPDDPTALCLQQGLATTNTNSTGILSPRRPRDVGNVAEPEEQPASAPPVSPGTSEAYRPAAGYVLVERELLGRVLKRVQALAAKERAELDELPAFLRQTQPVDMRNCYHGDIVEDMHNNEGLR